MVLNHRQAVLPVENTPTFVCVCVCSGMHFSVPLYMHCRALCRCALCAHSHTHCTLCVQTEAMEKRSLRLCVTFLEQIAKLTSSVVLEICAEQCNLNDQVESESISGLIQRRLILPKSISRYNHNSGSSASVDLAGGRGQT